jgi:hypothetical protein
MDKLDADEKRRRAITDWWEKQALREAIKRLRSRATEQKGGE